MDCRANVLLVRSFFLAPVNYYIVDTKKLQMFMIEYMLYQPKKLTFCCEPDVLPRDKTGLHDSISKK